MPTLQSFVKDGRRRTGSPQNGQAGLNPSRQAIGANAKVTLKKVSTSQQPQTQQALASRGLGNTQNTSAIMQQPPQSRPPGQGQGQNQKRDLYDTDAESLDTTVNHSIIEVEDSQRGGRHNQQDPNAATNDENSDPNAEESEEYEEEGDDMDDYQITQEDDQLLTQADIQHLSHEQKLQFLQQVQARPHALFTVEGDSYPTTTDGEPTEWEGGQEPTSEIDDGGAIATRPQRVIANGQLTRPFAPRPPQRGQMPDMFGANQTMPKLSGIFHQSATIRNQERFPTHATQQGGQPHEINSAALPANLNPISNQSRREIAPDLPAHSNNYQNTRGQVNRPPQLSQYQTSSSTRVQPLHVDPLEGRAPSNRLSSARTKANPIIQKEPMMEGRTVEESSADRVVDYDQEQLYALSYDALRNENFDKDPRAGPPALTDDMLQKPLVERLQFVQKNFDADRQSEFFHSLPTSEWEDAGDWFLDQFQSIIHRTKEARQNKRKLAQEFEQEVEKRYKHVSKKQSQVKEAMDKMKLQGESLVPRSPRASKSPRPRKG
ncbi:hypothetical protein N0V83_010177 [Neocucurbitaria cava]|uniref:Extracellular mutant protein 11 C-terminal domain-containing protein n=1 Tax=Neocucurbitaria cava TaxID=798079 RepID=A0A9W8XYD0_9PLEO|nr:hypothetical protein N0V83_010177 [Neocucurbitaria cava]